MHHIRAHNMGLVLATLLLLVLSCPQASAAVQEVRPPDGAAATNQFCPVSPDEAVDPSELVEIDGRRIYFCCAKCRRQYVRDPGRYADSLAAMTEVGRASAPSPGHEHGQGEIVAEAEPAHEHEHGDAGAGLVLLNWLGRFHPPTTHFPIAMLLGAVLAEALFIVTRRPMFATSARFCTWIGAGGAVAAAVLGWLFAGFAWSDGEWVMTAHRWAGTTVPVLSAVALVLRERWERKPEARSRRPYRVWLALAAVAVAANGFFGGALIYGLDHYAM